MRLLLDTHLAVWAALNPDKLSAGERRWMQAPGNTLVLSAVSVWELRLKWHSFHISGARKGPTDPMVVVAFSGAMGWELLPLTARHAVARLVPSLSHKDPFDELLLVQAQEEGLRLLTRDGQLASHPLVLTSDLG